MFSNHTPCPTIFFLASAIRTCSTSLHKSEHLHCINIWKAEHSFMSRHLSSVAHASHKCGRNNLKGGAQPALASTAPTMSLTPLAPGSDCTTNSCLILRHRSPQLKEDSQVEHPKYRLENPPASTGARLAATAPVGYLLASLSGRPFLMHVHIHGFMCS